MSLLLDGSLFPFAALLGREKSDVVVMRPSELSLFRFQAFATESLPLLAHIRQNFELGNSGNLLRRVAVILQVRHSVFHNE